MFCGTTEYGEEGLCRKHLAEYLDLPKSTIDGRITLGTIEVQDAATLTCGIRRRGNKQMIPFGVVLSLASERDISVGTS